MGVRHELRLYGIDGGENCDTHSPKHFQDGTSGVFLPMHARGELDSLEDRRHPANASRAVGRSQPEQDSSQKATRNDLLAKAHEMQTAFVRECSLRLRPPEMHQWAFAVCLQQPKTP